jgi:hypothetical protein
MQQRLKSLPRTAWTGIVAAELLDQFLRAAAHEAQPALDACLAREALTPLPLGWLVHPSQPNELALESRAGRRACRNGGPFTSV